MYISKYFLEYFPQLLQCLNLFNHSNNDDFNLILQANNPQQI
jgi:hypothetical protein